MKRHGCTAFAGAGFARRYEIMGLRKYGSPCLALSWFVFAAQLCFSPSMHERVIWEHRLGHLGATVSDIVAYFSRNACKEKGPRPDALKICVVKRETSAPDQLC